MTLLQGQSANAASQHATVIAQRASDSAATTTKRNRVDYVCITVDPNTMIGSSSSMFNYLCVDLVFQVDERHKHVHVRLVLILARLRQVSS